MSNILQPSVDEREIAYEILDRRTTNSRTYKLLDGSCILVHGYEPSYFKRDDEWVEINTDLVEFEGDNEFIPECIEYNVKIRKEHPEIYAENDYGFVRITLKTDFGKPISVRADKNALIYDYENEEIRFMVHPNRIRVIKVMKNEQGRTEMDWAIEETLCDEESTEQPPKFVKELFGQDAQNKTLELEYTVLDDEINDETRTYVFREKWTGRVREVVDKKSRRMDWTDNAVFPVWWDPVANLQNSGSPRLVQASGNSASSTTGIQNVSGSATHLIGSRTTFGTATKYFWASAAYIFTDVQVPPKANVVQAFFKFIPKGSATGNVFMYLDYSHLTTNNGSFSLATSGSQRLKAQATGRGAYGSASISVSTPPTGEYYAAGVTGAVQQMVNSLPPTGWHFGADFNLVVTGTMGSGSSSNTGNGYLGIEGSSGIPELEVQYVESAPARVQKPVYLGDFTKDDTVYYWFTWVDYNGAADDQGPVGNPGQVRVYEQGNTTESNTGLTYTRNYDSKTGFCYITVPTTDAHYEAGKDYLIVLQSVAQNSQSSSFDLPLATFSIENRYKGADVYTAKIAMAVDSVGGSDDYVVSWYKNGVLVTSGITTPQVAVTNLTDGASLFSAQTMTEKGSSDTYEYSETTNRQVAGKTYSVSCTATIDGATRTFTSNTFRDA